MLLDLFNPKILLSAKLSAGISNDITISKLQQRTEQTTTNGLNPKLNPITKVHSSKLQNVVKSSLQYSLFVKFICAVRVKQNIAKFTHATCVFLQCLHRPCLPDGAQTWNVPASLTLSTGILLGPGRSSLS